MTDHKLRVLQSDHSPDTLHSLPVGPERVRFGTRLRHALLWHNVVTAPHRWMASWLRRQGWVCFYLDEVHRQCGRSRPDGCWLALYQEEEARDGR